MTVRSIRSLVVSGSPLVRERLTEVISADPRLDLVGAIASGEEALQVLHQLRPDVISLDVRLPGIDGCETTSRIMAERPTPIVVLADSRQPGVLVTSMDALRAGALAVLDAPPSTPRGGLRAFARQLCSHLVTLSRVTAARQRPTGRSVARTSLVEVHPRPGRVPPPGPFDILAVAASTGGPGALTYLLGVLGPRFPLPVLVVQHIARPFHHGFVSWLGGVSPLPVGSAAHHERPLAGHVYVAPPDHHLTFARGRLAVNGGPPVTGQRPSANALLASMARYCPARTLGVVLTGMGDDGAHGLLELRRAGGYTIAEDAGTAVAPEMPAAAASRGAAWEVLPLYRIGPRLLELASAGNGHGTDDGIW